MYKARASEDINDLTREVADFLFAGGTVAALYGLDADELEALYALAYNLYNQARWAQALKLFSFLTFHDHLERRFHLGRAACLQMLKQHEDALRAYGLAYVLDVLDPMVSLRIAECLIALRRKEDALTALETVVALTEAGSEFAPIRQRAVALATLIRPEERRS
jgi:type III secretion system low calcium response chaperone LcrH/SycD